MMTRLQVLAALALVAAPSIFGSARSNTAWADTMGFYRPPNGPPLLPLSLDEFLARGGGLTRLKLKMENATAAEIAAELRRQTGLDVVVYDPEPRPVLFNRFNRLPRLTGDKAARFSVEAGGEMFWEAVRPWTEGAVGLGVGHSMLSPDQLSIGIDQNRASLRGRYVAAGPCHIALSQVKVSRSRTRSLQLEQGEPYPENSLRLDAQMWTDPRFLPLIAAAVVQTDAANVKSDPLFFHDESGSVMRLDEAKARPMAITLQAPEEGAKYFQLKGTLRLAVITRHEAWEIDLSKTPTATKSFAGEEGTVTARFKGIEKKDEGWIARMEFKRQFTAPRRAFGIGGDRFKFIQNDALGDAQSITRGLRFFDSKGKLLTRTASGSSQEEGGVNTLNVEASHGLKPQFGGFSGGFGPEPAKQGAPAKVSVDIPLEWREVQIPFELKDLPLP